MKRISQRRSGSALIIILPIVAILALLVVFILITSLFDRRLASNRFEEIQTASLTKCALDDVSGELSQIPLDRHWAAGPGMLRIWNGNSWDKIDLHSGAPAVSPVPSPGYVDGPTNATAAQYVQLNVRLPDQSYVIMPPDDEITAAPDMTVKWIYVLQDGTTLQPDGAHPLPNQGVIGRYAYWTDVENGRVNINTAGFGMINPPGGRFVSQVETTLNSANGPSLFNSSLNSYADHVWTPNPWMTDRLHDSNMPITFDNTTYPTLDRATAQLNSIQNLTAHPSSIDLSYLDGITVIQSFNTFRYAGSYFLRADARNSYCYGYEFITPNPAPDLSIRLFQDPADWKLIVGDAAYQQNKGYITVLGRSPDINPWGLPKISLSLCSKDGNALNDLTGTYDRLVDNIEMSQDVDELGVKDSRRTQIPTVSPTSIADHFRFPPPFPLIDGRTSFRDLTSAPQGLSNFQYIGGLMYDLHNILRTPVPGFTSFNSKYGDSETEQIGVELMSFADQTLNNVFASYAPHMPQETLVTDGTDWYGLGAPLVSGPATGPPAATNPGGPATYTRRIGDSGPSFVNEIIAEAQVDQWESLFAVNGAGGGQPVYAIMPDQTQPDGTVTPGEVTKFHQLPKGLTTNIGSYSQMVFLLRQPNPGDYFIEVRLKGEMMTPEHYGFAVPTAGAGMFELTGNTVCHWESTDASSNSGDNTCYYDLYGTKKPVGNTDPYSADNPFDFKSGWGLQEPNQGINQMYLPFPAPLTGANSYAPMGQVFSHIFVGPFAPGTNVSKLDLKFRLIFGYYEADGTTNSLIANMVPGIFPNFASGNPFSPAIYKSITTTNDPDDPNNQGYTYLDYSFENINVGVAASPNFNTVQISAQANDPRVTKHASDWTMSAQAESPDLAGTLGFPNDTIPAGQDVSDISLPPSCFQIVRGYGNPGRYLSNARREGQTASRILGLPGVGYLSSLPTGVDRGLPWKTLNFGLSTDSSPDWLLWSLLYVPFDRSIYNQTDGRMNINAQLYPFKDSHGDSLLRQKPLEALLGGRVVDRTGLAAAIAKGPSTTLNPKYTAPGSLSALPEDLYVYPGQVCQLQGMTVGGNEYQREQLPRDLADIVTTQSSDFRVFVVSQMLKQSPAGQIIPISTQRVEATLSRISDSGEQGYSFGGWDPNPPSHPSNVYIRSDYRSGIGPPNPAATRHDAELFRYSTPSVRSPLGNDHMPNTDNDWLVSQKIEISRYTIIK